MTVPMPSDRPDPAPGPRFGARTVVLRPGADLPFRRADWADAMVVVASGEVELVCVAGGSFRFGTGAFLVLDLPDLRVVRAVGAETVRLVALFRAPPTDESGADPTSYG